MMEEIIKIIACVCIFIFAYCAYMYSHKGE